MLQRWLRALGLFKRLHILAVRAPDLQLLGDSGWSLREASPHRCPESERENGRR
ncbi:MAG: hypothetical protein JWR14_1116 [Caballeronia sp.]|jgi:hypothetical protein|nr:hypothetical protein [Caballeronia sp.]